MLTQIVIENFKGIKSGEVSDLGKVNVIIGRNNSGKSCILDALCLAKYACGLSPQMFNEPLPMFLLRRRGIERSQYTVRNFWYNYDTKNTISFKLGFKNGEKLNIEIRWINDNQFDVYLQDLSGGISASINNKYFAGLGANMTGGFFTFRGDPGALSKRYPQLSHYLNELTLIDDYAARKLERLETSIFGRILEPRLDKRIVKELNDIFGMKVEAMGFIPASPTAATYRLSIAEQERSLHIDELGDGAKYATTILSLCLLLENSALLVEEIESHQHPGALQKFLLSIVKIAHEKNVQLFITTHSLEVIQTLASLPKEYDVRFFHVERSSDEVLTARPLLTIDVKLLSDLGVDIRNLEMFKRFVVVEGEEDRVFIETLLQRYGKSIEDIGYLVIARGKDSVKNVSAALTSTKKDIIVMLDYDTSDKDSLINSMCNTLKNRGYTISQDGNIILVNGGSRIIVLPMGLPDDKTLKDAGITSHSMEDYCLKLIELDEDLMGVTLKDLVNAAKTDFKELNKSKTILRTLAAKKDMEYKDVIRYIVEHADKDKLEKVIAPIKEALII